MKDELAEYISKIEQERDEFLRQLAAERESNKKHCEEWADDHTRLQEMVKTVLPLADVVGDSYGVPAILDLAEMLLKEVGRLKHQVAECEATIITEENNRGFASMRADSLESKLKLATDALGTYGDHTPTCPVYRDSAGECDCGWRETMERISI